MFRCYIYTIMWERINSCLLKLQLLKQSIKIHRFLVNTVVVWLHILGSYWCLYVVLFGSFYQRNILMEEQKVIDINPQYEMARTSHSQLRIH